jgi:uncharacterized membrane protein YhhN
MPALLPALIIAAIVSAGLTVASEYVRPPRKRLVYICKPLTTILILAIALLAGSFLRETYARAIVAGLLFSLMGDIWLVLPQDRFLYGLASFLVAQLCYAFAFAAGALAPGFAGAALALALVGFVMLRYLWRGIPASMRPAVIVYVAAILAMAALAVGRALGNPMTLPILAAVGAVLFVSSDATLAINRFRRPFRLAQAVVWVTYFSAQLLIAVSTFER